MAAWADLAKVDSISHIDRQTTYSKSSLTEEILLLISLTMTTSSEDHLEEVNDSNKDNRSNKEVAWEDLEAVLAAASSMTMMISLEAEDLVVVNLVEASEAEACSVRCNRWEAEAVEASNHSLQVHLAAELCLDLNQCQHKLSLRMERE